MTVETIERDGVSVRIAYGFGKLQRVRYMLASDLPASLKRIAISGGEAEPSDVEKVTPEETLDYNAKVLPQIVKLVLQSASDKPEAMSFDEYIDSYLPEPIGKEIIIRVRSAINVVTDDVKKK